MAKNPHILERGNAAIAAFRAIHDDREDAQLRDLLADLRHWAEINGVVYDHEDSVAADFCREETDEERMIA